MKDEEITPGVANLLTVRQQLLPVLFFLGDFSSGVVGDGVADILEDIHKRRYP
jgi:hypothetical protein